MSFHERTSDAARGRWRGILVGLGVPGELLDGRQRPCPVCGGRDRFRFDDKQGRGTSFCNVCQARDGFQLAEAVLGLPFSEVASRVDALVGNLKPDAKPRPEITEEDRSRILREAYLGSRQIQRGDLAHAYLASRGLDEVEYPPALRFHPSLRDGEGGIRPAILAMVGIPGEPKFSTIHRTFLRQDGMAKAEMASPRKLMPGDVPAGACVVLSDYHSGPLGIAEGIETAMSASALFGLPVWSAISSGMLAKWNPPDGCSEVVVFGDRDPGFAGQAAAYSLAHRLAARLPVTVRLPDRTGEDWADVYARSKGAAA